MPGWVLVPAVVAPVSLVAGLIIAAEVQPGGFDSIRNTISALAALDAVDRGVMTAALVGLGLGHIGTAWGLVGAGLVGRLLLGAGGLSTVLVAVFPLPSGGGSSSAHSFFALIAFVALAVWPLGLLSRRPGRPVPARLPVALAGTAMLLGLVGLFGVELLINGPYVGLTERMAAATQACWPLVVVVLARSTGQTPTTT